MSDQISDYNSEPLTVSIGGEDYPLSRIGPADYMATQDAVRAHRLSKLIESMRVVPDGETRGKAIAEVASAAITRAEMLQDDYARHYLIWRSLSRSGDFKQPWQVFREKCDPMTVNMLDDILFHICNLGGEGASDPTTGTRMSFNEKIGQPTSETSATISA